MFYCLEALKSRMHQWETHPCWGLCLLSSAPSDPGSVKDCKRSHRNVAVLQGCFCLANSASFRCQISDTGTYALLYSVDVSASILCLPESFMAGTWKMMKPKRNLLFQGLIFRWTMLNFRGVLFIGCNICLTWYVTCCKNMTYRHRLITNSCKIWQVQNQKNISRREISSPVNNQINYL